ncbi:hypothetical protein [Streptomyces chiangmaiensis]|uniref:Uncharacterized protein n=1 Tax=Streptomyces chiangmaiensis TaxID=766497 RepID=A0ABU7FUL4_9ACTN|nr:hypothetical protein [Streptomyces chiangmaiensis]MED7827590.1 hypothetical protein [Streptomyces chiangmaiensis]
MTITFAEVRESGAPATTARDRFKRVETAEGTTRGSGRISVTTKVEDINPGTWRVTATPVAHTPAGSNGAREAGPRLEPAQVTASTRSGPPVHGPGVRPFAASVARAVLVQGVLAARAQLATGTADFASLAGSVVGSFTAKAHCMTQHRRHDA